IIFCVKGKMKSTNKKTKYMFMEVNPRLHSQKPSSTRDLIVSSSGDLQRIELFARQTAEGWDSWGNEI
ncbi:MAG: MT-A70 family methyltransferase, partial [Burkholderiaceae bacterium]